MNDLISRQAAIDVAMQDVSDKRSHDFNAGATRAANRIKLLPTVEAEPKWIPVSERLPKQGQEVVYQCRASIIKVLKLDANGDWYQDANHCYMSGFVIAWMPLPKPYERKEE